MSEQVFLDHDLAVMLMLEALDRLSTHPLRSAAAFRNAALHDGTVMAVNPMLQMGNTGAQAAKELFDSVRRCITDGRMIDFGFIPNETIKAESVRARAAFEAGDLIHPYEEWVGVMAWEGGMNAYCIGQRPGKNITSVVELYGVALPPADVLLLYDVARIDVTDGRTFTETAPLHYPKEMDDQKLRDSFDLSRAANSLDPLVTMLRMLADASIPITRFEAPAALNKARLRKGKPVIPDHSIVHTQDYVAQLKAHKTRLTQGDGTGHHASPTAHWRRSHLRHLKGDRVVKVRSMKVNWRSNSEMHRLFSRVDAISK